MIDVLVSELNQPNSQLTNAPTPWFNHGYDLWQQKMDELTELLTDAMDDELDRADFIAANIKSPRW